MKRIKENAAAADTLEQALAQARELRKTIEIADGGTPEAFEALADLLAVSLAESDRLGILRLAENRTDYDRWKATNVKYQPSLSEYSTVIALIRSKLVEAKLRNDTLTRQAMSRGQPLPPALEADGVSFIDECRTEYDVDLLPDEFVTMVRVPNEAAISAHAGAPIPGVTKVWDPKLRFRRKAAD